MMEGICSCQGNIQVMWCIFILFCFVESCVEWKRKNIINLRGGGNFITSSYSVVQADVTGHQAESQGCLHFKPNFQFSLCIFLHSHWSWKLRKAHLCEEGGKGIKGELHFKSLTSCLFNLHYLHIGKGIAAVVCSIRGKWYEYVVWLGEKQLA